MIAQVHWWLAALSFGLGMVLTFTLVARPAKTQMPAWVLAEPRPRPRPEPVMKAPAAEAPTKKVPAVKSAPAKKKAVSKAPPRKRKPVSSDAATERIPVGKDPATERIPVVRKRPAKKATAAKKARPKGPPPRRRPVPKDAAMEKIPVSSEAETIVLPLMPYAPYGPGSMRANLDGSGPDGWTIKGRMDSRLFYAPDDECYDDTQAQVWFQDEEFAGRAFFTPWRNSTRKN
ncbi:channel accessory protein ArfC, sunset domain variant [Mycobacterium camsae]|uniref:channel accessory protein ArfC, sunset domain variant n=1 Tax=Mycobacterium gordonae TaxID=1778 RepID=UPI001F11AB10|nr:hypothetical protein [Mycobacterium gordonae]